MTASSRRLACGPFVLADDLRGPGLLTARDGEAVVSRGRWASCGDTQLTVRTGVGIVLGACSDGVAVEQALALSDDVGDVVASYRVGGEVGRDEEGCGCRDDQGVAAGAHGGVTSRSGR